MAPFEGVPNDDSGVLYARVSSREQEREGYSIPAQRRLLAEYARSQGYLVAREFIDVESAKNPGRKQFGEMLRLLESDVPCRIVLVEKTDRLYRNRTDSLAFEELIEERDVEVHLVKEGRVIGKDSRSQDKFMHDIHVAVAKHYVENLKEEVKKGMREKAEQGVYPGEPRSAIKTIRLTRSIDVDDRKSPSSSNVFSSFTLAGTIPYQLCDKVLLAETGVGINRSYLENDPEEPVLHRSVRLAGCRVQRQHMRR